MTDASGDAHLVEAHVSSEEMVRGSFLCARRDAVTLPDGTQANREYMVHPGAVMVVPLLESPGQPLRVILERQYRYPVQQVMIEFPAGKLDAGERTANCARRELQEETGYRATEWAKAGLIHPAIAYSTEFIEVWFAKGLAAGERQLDSGEFLDVFAATADELIAWCLNGRVTDAKTIAAAMWLQNYQAGKWMPQWSSASLA